MQVLSSWLTSSLVLFAACSGGGSSSLASGAAPPPSTEAPTGASPPAAPPTTAPPTTAPPTTAPPSAAVCGPGQAALCFTEGTALLQGTGVTKDPVAAARLFETGCTAGGFPSCTTLGVLAMTGTGVAEDLPRGVALLDRACTGNDAGGCYFLAVAKKKQDRGVDRAEIARLYDRSCTGGYMAACGSLGYLYHAGEGVTRDDPKAVELLAKACKADETATCTQLAGVAEPGDKPLLATTDRLLADICKAGVAQACKAHAAFRARQ